MRLEEGWEGRRGGGLGGRGGGGQITKIGKERKDIAADPACI